MERIEVVDWTGTDLSKESQGPAKDPASIQYRLVRELCRESRVPAYDIVFDDDGPGEAADIIAMRLQEDEVSIDLYHCKFARGGAPAARIDDLYEVCGQAQKNAFWKTDLQKLFAHLRKREARRLGRGEASRFEVGDLAKLREIEHRALGSKSEVSVWVVQPGLGKALASEAQRELLGVTELFLKEAYGVDFKVIGSA